MLQRPLLADALGVFARDGRPVDGVFLGLHEAVGPDNAEAPAVALDGDCGHAELLGGFALRHVKVLRHLFRSEVKDHAALADLLVGTGAGRGVRLGRRHRRRGQLQRRQRGRREERVDGRQLAERRRAAAVQRMCDAERATG